jgi:phosphoglycerate kinase
VSSLSEVVEKKAYMKKPKAINDLNDLEYYNRKVLMRVDFNVSINNNGIIGEDYRIRMTIPTIEYLTKRGAKLILMSHLGRPKSEYDTMYSLEPVAKRLQEIMLPYKVEFAHDCIGPEVQKEVNKMGMGDILLLENLRFHRKCLPNQVPPLLDVVCSP